MFTGKTILERIDASKYKLKSALTFKTEYIEVTVKNGLLTDGASIPRLFWTIIGCPMTGKYVGSALIHDGLYASEAIPRKEADKLFIKMLADNGVGYIKRKLMYAAVRVAGGFVWKKHKAADVEEASKYVVVKRKGA